MIMITIIINNNNNNNDNNDYNDYIININDDTNPSNHNIDADSDKNSNNNRSGTCLRLRRTWNMTAAVMSSPAVTMHTTVTAATTAVLLWPAGFAGCACRSSRLTSTMQAAKWCSAKKSSRKLKPKP